MSCHLHLEFLIWSQCLFLICGNSEERRCCARPGTLIFYVIFCANWLSGHLQQGLQNGPGSCSWKSVCSDTYTHCTKMAQAPGGLVWLYLKAFGLCPSGERLLAGCSVVTPRGNLLVSIIFPLSSRMAFEGCMLPLVCTAPLMADYSKLKLMCEKFCNKSAVFRQQSALLTFWNSRKHPRVLSLVNHVSCNKVACNGMADPVPSTYYC